MSQGWQAVASRGLVADETGYRGRAMSRSERDGRPVSLGTGVVSSGVRHLSAQFRMVRYRYV